MSNPILTTPEESQALALRLLSVGANAAHRSAAVSQPSSVAEPKIAPPNLALRLAKSLGAGRPDWRNYRNIGATFASSRVSYVESEMTEEQSREFD